MSSETSHPLATSNVLTSDLLSHMRHLERELSEIRGDVRVVGVELKNQGRQLTDLKDLKESLDQLLIKVGDLVSSVRTLNNTVEDHETRIRVVEERSNESRWKIAMWGILAGASGSGVMGVLLWYLNFKFGK